MANKQAEDGLADGAADGPVTRGAYDRFCASLPATTHVIQWEGASVWKVGGKIFAIWSDWKGIPAVSFKCSDMAYQMLSEQPGLAPAPYLARAKWIQLHDTGALSETDLFAYIRAAHALVAAKLTRKLRLELGLE
ncbi:MmcQ/YjbR family DNA-binding protein [Pannonibacter sp. Pt2]|uniref:MmcQ/YjbR family DNA-binding protein n=1 Tax=Pannonibacter anstelovis TaxID=3121537 RepID=A0ABU7ZL32_9HYPH